MKRKNFDYRSATVAQIVEQFKKSSSQLIYGIRKGWQDDEEMSAKVEEAYRLYKRAVLEEKLSGA